MAKKTNKSTQKPIPAKKTSVEKPGPKEKRGTKDSKGSTTKKSSDLTGTGDGGPKEKK